MQIRRGGRVAKGVTSLFAGVVRHTPGPKTSLVCASDALYDRRGRRDNRRARCCAASSGLQQRLPATRAGLKRRHEWHTPEPGRGVAGHHAASGSRTPRPRAKWSPATAAGHGSPRRRRAPLPGPGVSRLETQPNPTPGQAPRRCRGGRHRLVARYPRELSTGGCSLSHSRHGCLQFQLSAGEQLQLSRQSRMFPRRIACASACH
jgi:hypothetical protein